VFDGIKLITDFSDIPADLTSELLLMVRNEDGIDMWLLESKEHIAEVERYYVESGETWVLKDGHLPKDGLRKMLVTIW
jgi:hypothetical protein